MSSSDLLVADGDDANGSPFFRHSPCTDSELQLLSQPFYPSPEPSLDFLRPISSSDDRPHRADPSPAQPTSPPSRQMYFLSIDTPADGTAARSEGWDASSSPTVKLEVPPVAGEDDDTHSPNDGLKTGCHDTAENSPGLMQRSLSSQCLDRKPSFLFHPRFSSLMETHGGGSAMRRASSTGDLQASNTATFIFRGRNEMVASNHPLRRGGGGENSSPASWTEEGGAAMVSNVVRRYSAEERKQRIDRYRSKRNQRNFNKTIKYACRKTLAESRSRVRGRFAKNDETEEIPKVAEDDEELLWAGGFHYEKEELRRTTMRGAAWFFPNSSSSSSSSSSSRRRLQFESQYLGFF